MGSILKRNIFSKRDVASYNEKRRRNRTMCSLVTEFTDTKGGTWSCRIVDMSESGLGILTSARLMMGTTVNILSPTVEAEVVWTMENKTGLRIIR